MVAFANGFSQIQTYDRIRVNLVVVANMIEQ